MQMTHWGCGAREEILMGSFLKRHRAVVWSAGFLALLLGGCSQPESFYSNVLRMSTYTQTYSVSKVNFLWVLDNSGSMTARRQYIADNIGTFISNLTGKKAIQFTMSVTDTDFFSHAGQLIPDQNGNLVISNSTHPDVATRFAKMVANVTDSPTSFWEQPRESMYAALVNDGSKFLDKDAALAVIIVTDERDWSCKANCFGVEPENNTNWVPWEDARYSSLLSNLRGNQAADVTVFPIVGLNQTDCAVASVSDNIVSLAKAMGGVSTSGSICDDKLGASYQAIAKTFGDRGSYFRLNEPANGRSINVLVNGVKVPPTDWTFDEKENAILFTNNVPILGDEVVCIYNRLSN